MNIKNINYLWIFCLLLFCSEAIGEDRISASFSCKILDQVILKSYEGKSTTYSGYKGREKIGDYYDVSLELNKLSNGYLISIETKDLFLSFGSGHESMVANGLISKRRDDMWITLSADYFSMGSKMGSISGHRYYKNDWSLIYRGSSALSGHLISLNCMSVPANYDEIITYILKFHEYKN